MRRSLLLGEVWRLRREPSSDNFTLKDVKLIQQIKKKTQLFLHLVELLRGKTFTEQQRFFQHCKAQKLNVKLNLLLQPPKSAQMKLITPLCP